MIESEELKNMNFGDRRISQIRKITISNSLKKDALKNFRKDLNRNLAHAILTEEEREDYEMCFIAQHFTGHFLHIGSLQIDPIKLCILTQDHHIHNIIPYYLNYEHFRVGDTIPKDYIILLDVNILIDYERRNESNELLRESRQIEEIFDNAMQNQNIFWVTDRIINEFRPLN